METVFIAISVSALTVAFVIRLSLFLAKREVSKKILVTAVNTAVNARNSDLFEINKIFVENGITPIPVGTRCWSGLLLANVQALAAKAKEKNHE